MRPFLRTLALVVVCVACASVPLVAPTQSTLTLFVADTTIANRESTMVTATVSEQGGTPVHNGTVVTFSATLGTVHPFELPTDTVTASDSLGGSGQATAIVTASWPANRHRGRANGSPTRLC